MSIDAPIGTVIASLLDYPRFILSLQLKENNNLPVPQPIPQPPKIDPIVDRWVPADGSTSIKGSIYSRVTGETKAPDLRGLFVRGANSFIEPTSQNPESWRTDGWTDPDRRVLGDVQAQSFKSHVHTLIDRESGGKGGSGEPGHQGLVDIQRKTNPEGGEETRPNNFSVAFYLKIN